MESPTIVCLCGSTRFAEAFRNANRDETLAGRIVLTVGFFHHSLDADVPMSPQTDAALKELHLRKIDLADEILVLNVDGYVGESLTNEVRYAYEHQKRVRWMEKKIPIEFQELRKRAMKADFAALANSSPAAGVVSSLRSNEPQSPEDIADAVGAAETVSQTLSKDPVHQDEEDGKWYFWEETWADRQGPFDTEDKAREELTKYAKWLDGGPKALRPDNYDQLSAREQWEVDKRLGILDEE